METRRMFLINSMAAASSLIVGSSAIACWRRRQALQVAPYSDMVRYTAEFGSGWSDDFGNNAQNVRWQFRASGLGQFRVEIWYANTFRHIYFRGFDVLTSGQFDFTFSGSQDFGLVAFYGLGQSHPGKQQVRLTHAQGSPYNGVRTVRFGQSIGVGLTVEYRVNP